MQQAKTNPASKGHKTTREPQQVLTFLGGRGGKIFLKCSDSLNDLSGFKNNFVLYILMFKSCIHISSYFLGAEVIDESCTNYFQTNLINTCHFKLAFVFKRVWSLFEHTNAHEGKLMNQSTEMDF